MLFEINGITYADAFTATFESELWDSFTHELFDEEINRVSGSAIEILLHSYSASEIIKAVDPNVYETHYHYWIDEKLNETAEKIDHMEANETISINGVSVTAREDDNEQILQLVEEYDNKISLLVDDFKSCITPNMTHDDIMFMWERFSDEYANLFAWKLETMARLS